VIVPNTANPTLAQGAAFSDVPMLAGFDADMPALVPHGATVEIDPEARTLRVLGRAARHTATETRAN
jgi:predicted aconitase with swiveling domain